jgi:hypothetical protein
MRMGAWIGKRERALAQVPARDLRAAHAQSVRRGAQERAGMGALGETPAKRHHGDQRAHWPASEAATRLK